MTSQATPQPYGGPDFAPKGRDFQAAMRAKLRTAGLRPTRQRLTLVALLFANGDCHVTAETLHARSKQARPPISLATVYNALNQFTEAGLLREIAVQGSRTWYDTNTGPHYHFLLENEEDLLDIPPEAVGVLGLPQPPEGMEIISADLIIRVRKIDPRR
ncbi:ferric uptake regulator, Fur family [Methylocella silvestris BL2]|uniref:Ferric uptake regulation protein n=1 Tax=Methylocella silvestris (strain DSM 15510 / CIP 108128 / LMG 27833 / NCIMB 13906 / BL2) TaxID=395965 RepID=B8EJ44_METSB|nr:Fur family transcriptional regulator [Methylocella silvestris]ACK52536.1 ferric uptake regulator, Fur family [Methylocella silvestris BL2]